MQHLDLAGKDIVHGCTFDNNLPGIAEKEIVAVSAIVDELMHYLVPEKDCYLAAQEDQTKYAKAIDTAILVKNAPSYAALGFGGEGYCTFTIASRTGEGLTSASTFTKRRRCVMSDSLCIR